MRAARLLLPLLLLAAGAAVAVSRVTRPFLLDLPSAARQVSAPRVPPEFNINSGGPAVGRFIAEEFEWLVGTATSTFALDDVIIGGAEERNLPIYPSHRFGEDGTPWGYDIPVMEPGTYGCTVHFAETHSESFFNGARVFDLYIATSHTEEPILFDNIDIFAELDGAEFTVLTKTAEDLVIPGILSIRVNPSVGDAIISGITCERTGDLPDGVEPDFETDPSLPVLSAGDTTPPPTPVFDEDLGAVITGTEVNINVGGDALGRFIAEDPLWIRGTTSQWGGPPGAVIGGAEERNAPAIVSQRYGVDGSPWGLVIPVQLAGLYDCTLHWAEVDSASFAIGARIFNVIVQGQAATGIDVFADIGEAPFTAHVRTFPNLPVGYNLSIALEAVVGNAFLSAITCERTADLPPGVLPGLIPPTDPGLLPSPTDDEPMESPTTEPMLTDLASPMPMESVPPTPEEALPVTPEPSVSPEPREMPTTEPSAVAEASVAATATPIPVQGSIDVTQQPVPDVELDDPLRDAESGEFNQDYALVAEVADGGTFTNEAKDAVKEISINSFEGTSVWALTGISESVIPGSVRKLSSIRQDDGAAEGSLPSRTFALQVQALYTNTGSDRVPIITSYMDFVQNGEMNSMLEERGINDVKISMPQSPMLSGPGNTDQGNASTSTIVGSIVGGLLAGLVLIAFGAYIMVRRRRANDASAAAFDAPPPAMTESEMSSVMERSETAASVEYLDDDSTFTAATSRAGDHVDQVGFDKDVFGRGTSAGAHGTSAASHGASGPPPGTS